MNKKRFVCMICVIVILMMEVVLPLLFYGSYIEFLLDGLTNLMSMIISCTAGMVLLYFSGGFDWMCKHLINNYTEEDENEEE